MIDTNCEFECDSFSAGPGSGLMIRFGGINKHEQPEATEEDFYIKICKYKEDGTVDIYRLSITDPKYVYESDIIPEEDKERFLSLLNSNYKAGVESINEYMGQNIFNSNNIPDYNLL